MGTILLHASDFFQIFILLQHGAPVTDVPVIAAVAAEGFGLRADEPRVHDLGKVVVGLAEVGQQLHRSRAPWRALRSGSRRDES